MLLRRGLDCADKGLLVADIGDLPMGVATRFSNGAGHSFQWRLITPAEHHGGALLGKASGGGGTNPGAGTGNECDLALKSSAHCLLPVQMKAMPPLTARF
ncbi:hypothetical protein D3C80_1038580 [compost metagenome]